MGRKILWSLVDERCRCHGRQDCEEAARLRAERERILEAMEILDDLTPAPVAVERRADG